MRNEIKYYLAPSFVVVLMPFPDHIFKDSTKTFSLGQLYF
jgi:hypothetical protein